VEIVRADAAVLQVEARQLMGTKDFREAARHHVFLILASKSELAVDEMVEQLLELRRRVAGQHGGHFAEAEHRFSRLHQFAKDPEPHRIIRRSGVRRQQLSHSLDFVVEHLATRTE